MFCVPSLISLILLLVVSRGICLWGRLSCGHNFQGSLFHRGTTLVSKVYSIYPRLRGESLKMAATCDLELSK